MEAIPQQFDLKHEEINDPIDNVMRSVSATCDLVEEFLESVRARSDRSLLRVKHIESFTDTLSSLAPLVGGLSPSICYCHDSSYRDDPLGLVQTIEDLIYRLDSLLRHARWLALKVATPDKELARRLSEVAAGLSGSIASIISIVKCHRSTRALVAERRAAALVP